jgi:hypothetical protein
VTAPSEKTESDRRRYQRVPTNNPITYVLVDENGTQIGQGIGKAVNVSQSGILLETGIQLRSTYILLISTDMDNKMMEIVGKVVFSKATDEGRFWSGIKFQGEHQDNVKFRRDLIRVFHQKHVLGINPHVS